LTKLWGRTTSPKKETWCQSTWSRVTQLVGKFPTFYGTRKFNAAFTRACQRSLSRTKWIHSTTSHIISLTIHSNVIPQFTPRSSKWPLPFGFCDQNFVCISHLSHACYMSLPSHPPRFNHCNNMRRRVHMMNLFIT